MLTKVREQVRLGRLRLARLRQSDPLQQRAADNLLRFFALMLLLTVLARGMSGVTVPVVSVVRPEQGEISLSLTVDAIVEAQQSTWLDIPDGLTVQQVFCYPGQAVAAEEPILLVDPTDLAKRVEQEQLLLEQLALERESLLGQPSPDTQSLDAAELRLQRAQADYANQAQAGQTAIADAEREYQTTTERRAEAAQQLRAADQQLDRAAARLHSAESQADNAAEDQWEAEASLTATENRTSIDLLLATQRLRAAERDLQQAETEEERLLAEAALAEAQQAYDRQQISGQQLVAAARREYDEQVQEYREATARLAERQADYQQELGEQQAAAAASQQAEVASQAAERTLETTRTSASGAAENASRALEDAWLLLQQAQEDRELAEQQASRQAAANRIQAELLQWEMQEKQQLIGTLRGLQQAKGMIAAPYAGSISALTVQAGDRSSGPVVRLTNAVGGYSLLIKLSSTQYQGLGDSPVVRLPLGAGVTELPLPVLGQMEAGGGHSCYLPLPEGDYVTGQRLQVTIESGRQYSEFCLPVIAVHRDDGGYYLLLVEQRKTVLGLQNTLVRAPVELQAVGDQRVSVFGALTRDSLVVGSCSRPLRAGDRVRVRSE